MASNRHYQALGEAEAAAAIRALDEEWIRIKRNSPLAGEILNSPVSRFFRRYQEQNPEKYGEIFATDARGAAVAMSKRLSDYYQGDEQWWIEAFANGKGEVFLDDRGYDDSVNSQPHLHAITTVDLPLHKRTLPPGARKGISGERWVHTSWVVLLDMDQDTIFAPVTVLQRVNYLILALVLITGIAVAALLARSITRPIEILRRSAQTISEDNLDHRVGRLSRDEIGGLGTALDKMTGHLQQTLTSRDKLDLEIKERKQAEAAANQRLTLTLDELRDSQEREAAPFPVTR